MSARFTPGPWIVGDALGTGYDTRTVPLVVRNDNWYVAGIIADTPELYEQRFANANLIAAAPELYEALKEARGQVVALMLTCGHSAEAAVQNVKRHDAALAKASGETL